MEQTNSIAPTFRGYRLFAMDGFQINLPRSEDILKNNYQGRWVGGNRQQYYPTMYTVAAFDVLSEMIHDIRYSPVAGELHLAEPMVENLPKNSICIYDRLYPCKRMIMAHKNAQNKFIFRLRVNSFKEARKILELKIKRRTVNIEGVKIHIVKVKNPKTDQYDLFATNLPKNWLGSEIIRSLYNLRWECETGFLSLVETFKLEQWHSKSLNGVLQELYATLWLYNYGKSQILQTGQIEKTPLKWEYQKPNFKLIIDWIIKRLGRILKRLQPVGIEIQRLIISSTETRKRHSRSKPRETKYPDKRLNPNNTLWVVNGQVLN